MKHKKYSKGGAMDILQAAAPLTSLIPGVGPFIGPALSVMGALTKEDDSLKVTSSGRTVYATGGDMALSNNAFMVKGNPNQTDGNHYSTSSGKVQLDHNEVVKGTKVFSDDLKDENGRSFASLAAEIEKAISKVETVLKTAPRDRQALQTKTFLEKKSKRLFDKQEAMAQAKGLRQNETASFSKGGRMNDHIIFPGEGTDSTPVTREIRGSSIDTDGTAAGIDLNYKDNNMYTAYEGQFVKSGHQYNEGTKRGYGNYIVLETTDPFTKEPTYVRYSHLTKEQVKAITDKYKAGDTIPEGFNLGKAATTANSEVGSLTGPHTSMDFYSDEGLKQRHSNSNVLAYYTKHKAASPTPLPPEEFKNSTFYNEALNYKQKGKGTPTAGISMERLLGTGAERATALPTWLNNMGRTSFEPIKSKVRDLQIGPVQPNNTIDTRSKVSAKAAPAATPAAPSTASTVADSATKSTDPALQTGQDETDNIIKGDPFNNKTGDYIQMGAALANMVPLAFGYDKEKPNFDTTQIVRENYDPTSTLEASNAEFAKAQNAISTTNVSTKDAMFLSLFSKKLQSDNQIRTQYDQMNQKAGTEYNMRKQNQNQFNTKQLDYTQDLNARNKGAYMSAVSQALGTVGNYGVGLNAKQQQNKALDLANRQLQAQQKRDNQTMQVMSTIYPAFSSFLQNYQSPQSVAPTTSPTISQPTSFQSSIQSSYKKAAAWSKANPQITARLNQTNRNE